jgi:N6-adenosine-specific RNA methylase IME4
VTKYRTIVADPPWPIRWRADKTIGTKPLDYPTLTIAELMTLPIKEMAADESNLYLWTTNLFLHEAWGFQYRMLWTWCKTNGMGGHPRNATEHIVIASRGNAETPGRHAAATLNWLIHPAMGHSQKPEAFMDRIEQFSPGPRVELFSRRHRLGWDVWGDESANTASLPV